MHDRAQLLHNMSAPPKTVVRYSGLAALAKPLQDAGRDGTRPAASGVFGTPVRFELPAAFVEADPAAILSQLGLVADADAPAQLKTLLDARADELPLPDGCAVIPTLETHRQIWTDPLTALAVLAKCSDAIWLRAKQPALSAALARRSATLLVPPAFAARLPESDQ